MPDYVPRDADVALPSDSECARMTRLSPFIRQAGDEIRNGWGIGGRKLFDHLVVYTGSGAGTFTVGEETFRVGAGDFTWVPPDTYVSMEGDPSDMRVAYIHFDLIFDLGRSNWDAIIPGGLLDLSPWSERIHPPVDDPEITGLQGVISERGNHVASDLLTRICIEYNRRASPDHVLLSSLTIQLVNELIRLRRGLPGPESVQRRSLARAEEYIRGHLDHDLDVAALAARMRLSASHFRKLFRERYGISPSRMHRSLRIRRGCEMLVYSGLNVSETAHALGYTTVHSFSKAFRSEIGVCPTDFKKGR